MSRPPSAGDPTNENDARDPTRAMELPTAERLLQQVLRLGREIHLEMETDALVERFLATLSELFPQRKFLVRVLDLRSRQPASTYANSDVRPGIASERISVKRSSVEKTRLKTAIVNSARIKLGPRWDSPFPSVATRLLRRTRCPA